jgi:predicted TIM-barrel fold metal-dependent hydrolase
MREEAMAGSRIIDSDSHVMEVEETWGFLDPAFASRRPQVVCAPEAQQGSLQDAFWLIDGQIRPRLLGPGATFTGSPVVSTYARAKPFSVPSQGLTDVTARLRDLDAAGVDVQVIYPSVFTGPLTEDPRLEAALMRSYNTWMAGVARQVPERLKWMAVLPLRTPDEAVAEARRARELGAVGLAVFGTAGARLLQEPELDPVWAEVERQELPVGVHAGYSHPGLTESGTSLLPGIVIGFGLPVLMGAFSFTAGGILDRFPRLRVGFFEVGASWLPFWLERMDRYWQAASWLAPGHPRSARRPSEYLSTSQIYLTCEGEEPLLPHVLQLVGEDRVMISADMPHLESRENAVAEIRERTDLSDAVKAKLLGANAAAFYRL